MYRQHFGLTQNPFANHAKELWDDGHLDVLQQRFQWLLDSPGIGLLTGEPGIGKTSALRQFTNKLNPHRYHVIYTADTDLSRLDFYRQLALELSLEPAYRRAQLWRDIKSKITLMAEQNQILIIWVIDEAQNLPKPFFQDFASFLNFSFDSKNLITVWFVGHPILAATLSRIPYAHFTSRIQARVRLEPVYDSKRFAAMMQHVIQSAGCHQTLLSDSGLELIRLASKGNPRKIGQILITAMRLAVPKGLNHLPDDIIQESIEALQ